MLVQIRRDGRLRLFRQHEHALVSGGLAAAWRGLGREPEWLSFELVLATALHDLAWRELDAQPRLDPDTGRPCPFHAFPLEEKLAAYRRGLDRLGRIHPYAGLLGSLHYTSFPEAGEAGAFQEAERERRERLRSVLDFGPEEEAGLRRDLGFLQLFDSLSIFLCLGPPSADVSAQPAWVEEAHHLVVPGDGAFHLTWADDDVVHADPFPFRETVDLRLSYREVDGSGFASQRELRRAWEAAPERTWWLSVRSALRLA